MGEKLCPFARPVRARAGALRVRVSPAADLTALLRDFEEELNLLEAGLVAQESVSHPPSESHPESTLLVLRSSFLTAFCDMHVVSWDLQAALQRRGLVDMLQIVLFHPDARHSLYEEEGLLQHKAYALRSPYPTFHLLRERDVLEGIRKNPTAHTIPAKNAERLAQTEDIRHKWLLACR